VYAPSSKKTEGKVAVRDGLKDLLTEPLPEFYHPVQKSFSESRRRKGATKEKSLLPHL
jgi:hypothetical protein